MKSSQRNAIGLSREARVASLAAILVALGAICLDMGWRVAGVLILLAALGLILAFHTLLVRPARIARDAVLMLEIADGMREEPPRSPWEQIRSRGLPTLFHIRQALEAAAVDATLKTVIVEISAPAIGLATAQELHDLLRALVAAGKRVVAVLSGDNVTVHDYLLACGAGEIVVNPDSALLMLGVTAGNLFLKNALAKAGVQAQTLQWKEYKGAAEMFTREAMSPEVRESLEAILRDWNDTLANAVAAARNLSVERARKLLAAGFIGVRTACAEALVDRAGYIDDLRAELAPGDDDNDDRFVGLSRYLRHVERMREGPRRARLALIHGLGPVIAGDAPSAGEFLSGEAVAEEIRQAAHDDRVRAIIFRVNSPGGSAVGSDLVWRAVREARRRGKPVVVSMGDVAGSGGYYVAMGADAIVAEPSTITGSIGVVYTKFSIGDLMSKVGVGIDVAKFDQISDALSIARPMSAAELAQLNDVVGELYANFTAKVAEGRRLDAAATENLARGRVWSGVAAKAHGLIDELGGVARAVAIAREKAGLKPGEAHDLVLYPAPNIFAALNLTLGRAEASWTMALAARALGVPERWAPAMIRLMTNTAVNLLCPFIGK